MKLSKDEVLKIANLARLELSPGEVETYGDQLSAILDYVKTLGELDVKDIEPTAHAVLVPAPFREDEPRPDATREKSLANAPDREETFFKVPKVIG